MATSSKEKKLSRSFKERLDMLSCPYTENVEESWILELLLTPGEPRIRLLQWLFTKFDSKLGDVLDPGLAPAETKMDSRIQRLLFISSNLGLCNSDEADLIRGVCRGSQQIAYMDTLLDLVCIVDCAESPHSWSTTRSGISASNFRNTRDQFSNDCGFIDCLASQLPITSTLKSDVKLLPPDIVKQIEISRLDDGARISNLTQLTESASQLSKALHKQTEVLKELKMQHQCPDKDIKVKSTVKQTIRLILTEFNQLVTSFSCCYENDMKHWCTKTPPQLNEAGPCFKRVHSSLQQFLQMINDIEAARKSFHALCNYVRTDVAQIRQQLTLLLTKQGQKSSIKGKPLADSLMNSLKSSIDILEESIERAEVSFLSGKTMLNSSVVSAAVRVK